MAVPFACFIGVCAVCVVGIIIGSFCDFSINEALANKTDIGTFFATYGLYFAYCLFPAAGMCLFKGLSRKGGNYRMLAWVMLIVGYYMAVYYSNYSLHIFHNNNLSVYMGVLCHYQEYQRDK